MQRRTSDARDQVTVAIQFAWWLCFLATLTLVLGLGLIHSAPAKSPPGAAPATAVFLFDAEEEWEGAEEFGAEECPLVETGDEAADIEAELACEEAAEQAEEGTETAGLPAECLLSDADATVAAKPARGTVRLTIRYRARSAATVDVDLRLRGSRGGLAVDRDRERFSRGGVYRATARLGANQMKRVVAARSFTVGLRAVNTPGYCHRHLDQQLTVRRGGPAGLTWSAPPARLGLR